MARQVPVDDDDLVDQINKGIEKTNDLIRNRSQAQIEALSREQRFAEYGAVTQEDRDFLEQRTKEQNAARDLQSTIALTTILGGFIGGALISGATAGAAAIAEASTVAVETAAIPTTLVASVPVAEAGISALAIAETAAAAGGGVSFLSDLIESANDLAATVGESPFAPVLARNLLGSSNAASAQPNAAQGQIDAANRAINDINRAIDNIADNQRTGANEGNQGNGPNESGATQPFDIMKFLMEGKVAGIPVPVIAIGAALWYFSSKKK